MEDNGPGITPEFIPFMFERFRQADSSTTRTHKGLGLGLAIVRSLVEMHGGTIAAGNVAEPGRVGRRVLHHPSAAAGSARIGRGRRWRPAGGEHAALARERSVARPIRVLVVEDDADARELIGADAGPMRRARHGRELGRARV